MSVHVGFLFFFKNKNWLPILLKLYKLGFCLIYFYHSISACFDKLLRLFAILTPKYKEMRSAVSCLFNGRWCNIILESPSGKPQYCPSIYRLNNIYRLNLQSNWPFYSKSLHPFIQVLFVSGLFQWGCLLALYTSWFMLIMHALVSICWIFFKLEKKSKNFYFFYIISIILIWSNEREKHF